MALFQHEFRLKGTKIKILTDTMPLARKGFEELKKQRELIEDYIKKDPMFLPTLKPHRIKDSAPEIVRLMAEGAKAADVGPMAAVAGTLAEFACKKMIKEKAKVAIVENNGDIYACTQKDITIGIFSGQTKIKENLAFKLNKENTPVAICSSSSKLSDSMSFGKCDLATVFSKKGAVADAVATAAANKVKSIMDIETALNWTIKRPDVLGAIIIKDNKVGVIGDIPKFLIAKDEKFNDKITEEEFYEL